MALRQAAFAPRPVSSAEELVALRGTALGEASVISEPDGEHPHGLCLDSSFDNDLWARPALKLGTFAVNWVTRMFVLPRPIAVEFDTSDVANSVAALERWLSSIGQPRLDELGLPEIPFTNDQGFGWREVWLRCLFIAEAQIVPDVDCQPKLQLEVRGLQDRGWDGRYCIAYHPDAEVQDQLEFYLALRGGHPGACVPFVGTETGYLHSIELPEFFRPGHSKAKSEQRFFGLLDESPDFDGPFPTTIDVDEEDAVGWTDDALLAPFLIGGEHTFYPVIEAPDSHPVPAKPRSLAAAFLRNLRYGSDDGRIDRLLIAQAADLATKGLRYYEALIDNYRDALGRISASDRTLKPGSEG